MDNFVKNKTIVSTHDLYNISPQKFIGMKYEDVLVLKIKAAQKVAEECLEVHYMKRDTAKINRAMSAVKYNTELLSEMGLSIK